MVDRALEESQEGGLPTRVWRYATGGEVDVAISPQVSYSNHAIDEFIAKVAAEVNTRAGQRDDRADDRRRSRASPGTTGVSCRRGRRCARGSSRWSSAPTTARSTVPVDEVEPEVTKADLADAVPDLPDRRPVDLHRDPVEGPRARPRSTRSRSAQPAYPTPTGLYSIQNKQVDPVWSVPNSDWAGELAGTTVAGGSAENPLKARWMGITDGAGFHGTDDVASLGTAASHGCVRMAVPDVMELYDQVPVGTPGLHRLRRLPRAVPLRRAGVAARATNQPPMARPNRAAGAACRRSSS